MIKPTVGRVVLFKSKNVADTGNGEEVPAIITRVFSDTCVNLCVLRDTQTPSPVTSVVHTDDFENSGQSTGWRWMDYQKAVAAGEVAPLKHA